MHPSTPGQDSGGKQRNSAEPEENISDILEDLATSGDGERVSVGQVAERMRGRAYGMILLVLALPETIPMVGLSAILALPIFVIGSYMVWHGQEVALPKAIRERSIKREHLRKAVDKMLRFLRWLERISKPRWPVLAHASRLHGAVCMVMALVLAIPMPGVNIFAAFGVFGIGLGMLQRDGLIIAAAFASSVVAVAGAIAVFTGIATLAT